MMIERFRNLSVARKIIVALALLFTPLIVFGQVMFVTSSVFEGGQKFGIVVTTWTLLALAAAFAWKAAR
jgi:hypothetical protein